VCRLRCYHSKCRSTTRLDGHVVDTSTESWNRTHLIDRPVTNSRTSPTAFHRSETVGSFEPVTIGSESRISEAGRIPPDMKKRTCRSACRRLIERTSTRPASSSTNHESGSSRSADNSPSVIR
jgi:hypothetical protein